MTGEQDHGIDDDQRDAGADGLVDLYGLLAYGELSASLRMSADASSADDIGVQEALARMAHTEFGHYELFAARLRELGHDPVSAMGPFVSAISLFHDRTTPRDWTEGLVKALVGDGIARDFTREIAANLGPEDQTFIETVLDDSRTDDAIVSLVTQQIAGEPTLGGRLALWGRRLVGEAVAQAQFVAAERDALTNLILGGQGAPGDGMDLAELGRMFVRLTDAHAQRMTRLGLAA